MASLSQEDLNEWPLGGFSYERHRPEETLLYQIIEEHWPRFHQHLEQQGKHLPSYVKQEFEDFWIEVFFGSNANRATPKGLPGRPRVSAVSDEVSAHHAERDACHP